MADYSIVVNTDGAVSGLDKLGKSTDQATQKTVSLKSELRTLQTELATLDPNDEKFVELSRRTGEIKDKLNDAAEATRANAGPAFETLGNNASLLTQRLSNLDFEGVGQSLKGMSASLRNVSFKEISAGFSGMTQGLASLGKAILANPILLLASVIIGIAMNFDKLLAIFPSLNEALTGVSAEMANALETAKQQTDEDKKKLELLNLQDETLKRQGLTEEQILNKKIAAAIKIREDLETQITLNKIQAMQQIETASRNQEIAKKFIELITFPIQFLLAGLDELTSRLHDFGAISDETFAKVGNLRGRMNDSISSLMFDPEQAKVDAEKTIKELDMQLITAQNMEDGYLNQKEAKHKAHLEAIRKQQEDADKAELERRKKLQGEFDAIESKKVTNQLNSIKPVTPLVISESQKQFEAKKKADEEQRKIDEDYSKYQAQNIEARFQMASDGINRLIALNNSFSSANKRDAKRQFEINKALSLASAILSGIDSGMAAFAQGTKIGGPPLGVVYAAIAGAVSLAQINKIRQSKFDEGGGSSPSTSAPSASTPSGLSGGTNTQAPQFSPVANNYLNNRPDQMTTRAYVLSGNVASELEASQKIRDRARL